MHYRALPLASKVVEGLQEIQAKPDGVCKGCVKGKNTKKTFPSSESKEKGILEIIHFVLEYNKPTNKIINHYLINFLPTSLDSWHPLAP